MLGQLLWEFGSVILLIAAAIIFGILQWQKAKITLYALMLEAKSLAKELVLKSAKEEEDWVVDKAYEFLPKIVSIQMSEEAMRNMINKLYSKSKYYSEIGNIKNNKL
jgi:hypothetical protein